MTPAEQFAFIAVAVVVALWAIGWVIATRSPIGGMLGLGVLAFIAHWTAAITAGQMIGVWVITLLLGLGAAAIHGLYARFPAPDTYMGPKAPEPAPFVVNKNLGPTGRPVSENQQFKSFAAASRREAKARGLI